MDMIEKAVSKLGKSLAPDTSRHSSVEANSSPQGNPPQGNPLTMPRSAAAAPQAPPTTPKRRWMGGEDKIRRKIEIDLAKFQSNGMIMPDGSRSRVREEYRNIKQPVLLNAAGRGAIQSPVSNLVMVTSSIPGEGKTFTATNLAMSIASERDKTVLLVDADVLRFNLSSFFGVQKQPGLVDYLINDDLALSDVMIGTDVPSLTLLPAGNTHHLTTELLSSEHMKRLALELSQRYPERIVIFDSPPLLHTSEARVLAQLVGQIVMVVEAERTPRGQVFEAYDLLRDASGDTSISLVLNKSRKSREWSYYYGYGYGYGYGNY